MRVLDLFSGIGGFSLGLERAGMQTVAFCEIEPYARRVLAKHWPKVPIYDDVRTLTAARLAADGIAVDLICGGFPCQDISCAGKGAGLAGERSGLWSEYARLIGELRPRFVIVENVAALLGRGLDVVLGDLAALGFDAEWHCIPASAVGAPHRRDRLWIVAYPGGAGRWQDARGAHGHESTDEGRPAEHDHISASHGESNGARAVADADSSEWGPHGGARRRVARPERLPQGQEGPGGSEPGRETLANADGARPAQSAGGEREGGLGAVVRGQAMADAERWRLQGGHVERAWPPAIIAAAFGRYSRGREFGETWRTEPDVGRVAYGIPASMDRLKGLGNAVVPQIPEIIGRAILEAAP